MESHFVNIYKQNELKSSAQLLYFCDSPIDDIKKLYLNFDGSTNDYRDGDIFLIDWCIHN